MKRLIAISFVILIALSTYHIYAQTPVALHVDGVRVVRADGQRVIFIGANVEMFRDYRGNGSECDYTSDGFYAQRNALSDRIVQLGVNSIRLNYSYKNLTTAKLAQFVDIAQGFMQRGVYVMPTDHTYTGGALTNASQSYPTMRAIIAEMRKRGMNLDYLIWNPFNEPGPDISAGDWLLAQQKVLLDLRETSQFDGLVVLDGTGWATMLDVTTFKRVQDYDRDLRTRLAGESKPANVAFSNHLYPNITSLPAQIATASNQVPLVVGELGQENPGASPTDPQYVRNVISQARTNWIPKGHSGLFSWIINWCDVNKQLEDWQKNPAVPYSPDEPWTTYGNLWIDNYYKPMVATLGTVVAPPTLTTATPTRTATAVPSTATRTPTRTRTPGMSLTPSATPSPTLSATPTDKPKLIITGEFGGTPFSGEITLP